MTVGVEKRDVITHRVRSKPDSIRQHTPRQQLASGPEALSY
jgi:hypothetical protein